MGTRSVVAIPTADGGWRGRYVHWDGYPSGVGSQLVAIVNRDGLDKATRTLVHERYGWSIIHATHAELSKYQDNAEVVPGYGIAYTDAQPNDWETNGGGADSWCEWAYVLTPDGIAVWEHTGDRWEQRPTIELSAPDKAH